MCRWNKRLPAIIARLLNSLPFWFREIRFTVWVRLGWMMRCMFMCCQTVSEHLRCTAAGAQIIGQKTGLICTNWLPELSILVLILKKAHCEHFSGSKSQPLSGDLRGTERFRVRWGSITFVTKQASQMWMQVERPEYRRNNIIHNVTVEQPCKPNILIFLWAIIAFEIVLDLYLMLYFDI